MFYQTINWLDSFKELVSVTIPNVTAGSDSGPGGSEIDTRLHIFLVSMLPANRSGIDLEV
jgi:alpha-L-fucosidase